MGGISLTGGLGEGSGWYKANWGGLGRGVGGIRLTGGVGGGVWVV